MQTPHDLKEKIEKTIELLCQTLELNKISPGCAFTALMITTLGTGKDCGITREQWILAWDKYHTEDDK